MGVVDILLWTAALVASIAAGGGYGVVALSPPEFRLARGLFFAAGAAAAFAVVLWGYVTDVNVVPRVILTSVLSALVGASAIEAVRWVSRREAGQAGTATTSDAMDFTIGLKCESTKQPRTLRDDRPTQTLQIIGPPEPGRDPRLYAANVQITSGAGPLPELQEENAYGQRCTITNYGTKPISFIEIVIKIIWREVVEAPPGIQAGDTLASAEFTLSNFTFGPPPNQTDFVYIYNRSNVYVSGFLPLTARVRRAGQDTMEEVRLISKDTPLSDYFSLSPADAKKRLATYSNHAAKPPTP